MNRREATAGRFFTLVLVLSLPLWLADRLLGDRRLPDPMQLPISALMFAVPPLGRG